ncbi:MAG: aminoglycoside phosphotransferase family protein [Vicinamibacterales bacterium]
MPEADVLITPDLVRALLAAQHADLATRPLADAGEGWDNRQFRLGADLAVRLPRRAAAASSIQHEQQWVPRLAPRLPVPVPTPVRVGRPGCGFPWAWSIVPWFDGHIAAPPGADSLVEGIAGFLLALHQPAPADAPVNVHRASLASRSDRFAMHVAGLDGTFDRLALTAAWEAALTPPTWAGPPLWLHGDLHPANLIVRGERLHAVIDFGDVTSGDPAVDLAVAWMLWPEPARRRFRDVIDSASRWTDEATWRRARGWALAFGLALAATADDHPVMRAIGCRTIGEVLAE